MVKAASDRPATLAVPGASFVSRKILARLGAAAGSMAMIDAGINVTVCAVSYGY